MYAVPAVFTTDVPKEMSGVLFGETCVKLFNTCNCATGVLVASMLTFRLNVPVVGSLVEITIVAGLVFVPTTVGVPVTVNACEAPAAMVTGKASVGLITYTEVPVIEFSVSGALPLFLIENPAYGVPGVFFTDVPREIAVLFVPTSVVLLYTCNCGAAAGVPVAVTFSLNDVVVGSSVKIVIIPVLLVPTTVGVAVTVNVALAPTATVAGTVETSNTNTVEPDVIELTLRTAVPLFVMVNVYGVAAEPTADVPTRIAVLFVLTVVTPSFTTKAGVGALVPVDVTLITNEAVVGSFEAIVIVPPFEDPIVAGVAITFNVSEAPAATVLAPPGVTAYPAEPVIDAIFSTAPPVLVIVIDVFAGAGLPLTAVPTFIAGVAPVVKTVVPFLTTKA